MDAHDLAEDDAGAADFQGGQFAHSRLAGESRFWARQPGRTERSSIRHLQFVDAGREINGAHIHRRGQFLIHQIDDKFTGVADVLRGVLAHHGRAGRLPTRWRQWGIGADVIVGAEGAALRRPARSRLVIQAMGRGTTSPMSRL